MDSNRIYHSNTLLSAKLKGEIDMARENLKHYKVSITQQLIGVDTLYHCHPQFIQILLNKTCFWPPPSRVLMPYPFPCTHALPLEHLSGEE